MRKNKQQIKQLASYDWLYAWWIWQEFRGEEGICWGNALGILFPGERSAGKRDPLGAALSEARSKD